MQLNAIIFNCLHFLLTLIHSINAIVEAATTIVDASAAIIMFVDGCQLAAADVALLLSLASHLENEIMNKECEI